MIEKSSANSSRRPLTESFVLPPTNREYIQCLTTGLNPTPPPSAPFQLLAHVITRTKAQAGIFPGQFCPTCGTPVFWRVPLRSSTLHDLVVTTVGNVNILTGLGRPSPML